MNLADFQVKASKLIFLLCVSGYALFPMRLELGSSLILSAIILWLFYKSPLDKIKKIMEDRMVLICGLIVFVSLLSFFYGVASWGEGAGRTFSRYVKFLFFGFILYLTQDRKIRDWSINAFLLGVGFIVFSMYLNVYLNLPWSVTQNTGWGSDHTVVGDYITQNLMVCLFVILCLDKVFLNANLCGKIFFSFAFISGLCAIFLLSPGRTGYLLTLSALCIYLFLRVSSFYKWLLPLVIFSSALLVYKLNPVVESRLNLAVQETLLMLESIEKKESPVITSIGARVFMWKNTVDLIEQKPILGWGLGGYKKKWCDQVSDEEWCDFADTHPHNQYLMFWVELGLAGLLLFLAFIFLMIRKGLIRGGQGAVLVAFVAFFAIDCLFNSPLWVRREYHFFFLMFPLIYSHVKFSNEK